MGILTGKSYRIRQVRTLGAVDGITPEKLQQERVKNQM